MWPPVLHLCVCDVHRHQETPRVSHLTPWKTSERQSECKTCLIFNPLLWLFSAGTLKFKHTPWLYVECQLWLQTHSFLPFVCLVPAGHRTAEEGGEKMGQKVKMDEHEGGVWTSVLYGLAEPLCSTRPRQGRRVPVHCVRAGRCAELCWTLRINPGPDLNEHELLLTTSTFSFIHGHSFVDISGCSAQSSSKYAFFFFFFF